ncbi:MAG: hypothetical protein IMZ52_02320 [Actinobacteria bacterium]|nr:hypothetical protein [Actinomycetota bacterium]MBE3114858.1 hypothetical protein [Actinomycetota bacterium]
MKQKLKIGDCIKKGDIILIIEDKERIIVESKVNKQLTLRDRIPVIVRGYTSLKMLDLFTDGADNQIRLCGWFTIDDYYKINEREALAYLI